MPAYNAFYAQSGGVTPVINASETKLIKFMPVKMELLAP